MAIVGAGFTGLWAAYFLALLQPDLRIAIVEREIAGFGPSGRNGGWASAGLAGNADRYARLRGDDAVRRGERAMADAVGEIGEVIATEGIDCGWLHSGSLMVATSAPQVTRLHEGIAAAARFGMGEDDLRLLEPDELDDARARAAARARRRSRRTAPASIPRGWRAGWRWPASGAASRSTSARPPRRSSPAACAAPAGTLRAASVLRATEAFTVAAARRAPRCTCRSTR